MVDLDRYRVEPGAAPRLAERDTADTHGLSESEDGDRVEALLKSVFSSEAALAEKEEGLRSGLNTGLDVLDARRELFAAKRDLTQARYVYILSGLRLKLSAGTLGVDDLEQIDAYLQ